MGSWHDTCNAGAGARSNRSVGRAGRADRQGVRGQGRG